MKGLSSLVSPKPVYSTVGGEIAILEVHKRGLIEVDQLGLGTIPARRTVRSS